jgi:hypothetical protein
MKGLVVIALLIIGAFPSGAGRANILTPPEDVKAEQEVIDLTRQFNKASVGKYDLAVYERILANDFYMINTRGQMMPRAEVLMHAKAAAIAIDSLDTHEISARVYGKGAVVVEHGTAKVHAGDKNYTEEYRSTKLYLNRQGRWQMVTSHVTPVPPK